MPGDARLIAEQRKESKMPLATTPGIDGLYPYQRDVLYFLTTPGRDDSWVRRMFDRQGPQDSIILDLPWGECRRFFVRAGDPRNPVYWWEGMQRLEIPTERASLRDFRRYEWSRDEFMLQPPDRHQDEHEGGVHEDAGRPPRDD